MSLQIASIRDSLSQQARISLGIERLKWKAEHKQTGKPAPEYWQDWLTELFSNLFYASFAARHIEFWEWIEAIQPGIKPDPFFAVWGRGGAKTTNAEAAAVRLGAENRRKFCLYVRGTQDKANESVQNIAAMLESSRFERHYPAMANRKVGKYGHAKGWRIDTLRCANGFNVIGLGLDAAVRGVKIEEFRPDVLILDDIDSDKDTLAIVTKKIRTLTKSILPAGSPDVAILGLQNLIHASSIFSQLVDGTADFLYNRVISGPYPAVDNLEYERQSDGTYKITGGEATWEGQSLEVCQSQINEWGLTAFLQEAQHEVDESGGVWDHVEFNHCDFAEVPELTRGCVWCDPAVTNTDESDSHGIQADGLGVDGKLYRLYSWEAQTSPEDVLKRAILKAVELGFEKVGVETDQGGDVWRPAYKKVVDDLLKNDSIKSLVWYKYQDEMAPEQFDEWFEEHYQEFIPTFADAKAGAGHGSKAHRNSLMLASYDRGEVIHVRGTHRTLEKSLKRFPKKPLDLADAAYWGWNDLMSPRGIFFG